jgi:hypothetical protein
MVAARKRSQVNGVESTNGWRIDASVTDDQRERDSVNKMSGAGMGRPPQLWARRSVVRRMWSRMDLYVALIVAP